MLPWLIQMTSVYILSVNSFVMNLVKAYIISIENTRSPLCVFFKSQTENSDL